MRNEWTYMDGERERKRRERIEAAIICLGILAAAVLIAYLGMSRL